MLICVLSANSHLVRGKIAALTLPRLGFFGVNEPTIQRVSELIPPRSGSTDCTFYFGPVPVSDRCGIRFKISVGKLSTTTYHGGHDTYFQYPWSHFWYNLSAQMYNEFKNLAFYDPLHETSATVPSDIVHFYGAFFLVG